MHLLVICFDRFGARCNVSGSGSSLPYIDYPLTKQYRQTFFNVSENLDDASLKHQVGSVFKSKYFDEDFV